MELPSQVADVSTTKEAEALAKSTLTDLFEKAFAKVSELLAE